ncbi:hypothetical protein WMF30_36730 [Sorangium sp. So ce134]
MDIKFTLKDSDVILSQKDLDAITNDVLAAFTAALQSRTGAEKYAPEAWLEAGGYVKFSKA